MADGLADFGGGGRRISGDSGFFELDRTSGNTGDLELAETSGDRRFWVAFSSKSYGWKSFGISRFNSNLFLGILIKN